MARIIDAEQGARRLGSQCALRAAQDKESGLTFPDGASVAAVLHLARSVLLQHNAESYAACFEHQPPGSTDSGRREAAIETELLLGHILGFNRTQLLSSLSAPLHSAQLERYADLLDRRLSGEPVAYITGHREFFGLDMFVDARVLIPRPETELIVENALAEVQRLGKAGLEIVDVGTGSGAIAISVAKNIPNSIVYATDISGDALAVAAHNCRRHAAPVTLLHGDLLEPLPGNVDIVLANLPYIAPLEFERLPVDIRKFEPRIALYAEDDGLAIYRKLCIQLPAFLRPGGILIAEVDPAQAGMLSQEIAFHLPGSHTSILSDYSGRDRVVITRSSNEHA